MAANPLPDDLAIKWFTLALAAADQQREIWPNEAVEQASLVTRLAQGRIPSLDAIIAELGEQRAKDLYARIIEKRKFFNFLIGHGSPCHYCGSEEELQQYHFAMMRVDKTGRNWGSTAITAAMSAAAVPLLGVAALAMPGRTFHGSALNLRLKVCKLCQKKNSNIFGLFMLNEERASHHPAWKQLKDAGFEKFFDTEKIPMDLRLRVGKEDL